MKNFILCCALFWAPIVVADAGLMDAGMRDAGLMDAGVRDAGLMDAGVSLSSDAGVLGAVHSMDAPLMSAKGFYAAVKEGNGWLAAMLLLFFLVGTLRVGGRRLHAMIPDDTQHAVLKPVETALYFIFDTKIGGWVLNWLSAIGGCLATAAAAGMAVDASAWKVAILASTGGTALIELKDDVMEWLARRAAKKAAEVSAAAAAAASATAVTPALGVPIPTEPPAP